MQSNQGRLPCGPQLLVTLLMKLKVFTLRFQPEEGGFDDTEVVEFLDEHVVLDVTDHFFVHEKWPTWALLVRYREAQEPKGGTARRREDWRATLPEAEHPLFDALRRWRNERAKKQGRPAYVLLTNRQLAAVSRARPTTIQALGEIEGVRSSASARARG